MTNPKQFLQLQIRKMRNNFIKFREKKMNRKQFILGVICCLLLISAVQTQDAPAAQAPNLKDSQAQSIKKDYSEKVFVDLDEEHFYEATISNKDCKIQVAIFDQDLKTTKIVFKRPNPVVFIDAYQNIILVKEVTPAGNILAYFVLIIRYDTTNNKFFIDYFSVNAQIDDEFFGLAKYYITQIAELDINRVWVAVYVQGPTDFVVYKINIANKLNTLLTFGYLNQSNGEKITGGNSAVLFDQTHNQFLVDTRNCRPDNTTFSVYDPVPICKLTDLPLYECNNVVNLIGSYFQYVSEDEKKKAITTFLYHGYGTEAIQGATNIKSKKPIRLIYDEYNFFIAISDCDIYLTNVYYDDDSSSFKVFAGLLSSVITKASKRAEIYEIWSRIETIVFIENKFYFLSCGKFYVYGTNPTQFTQLYENPCVYKTDNLTATLFVEINKYLQKTK